MNSNIGHYDFTVEPFSEDCTGRLSWGFLGNHLLRCASLHAGSHGFGYDQMHEANHVWVLSRLVVQLDRMPRTGERYAVETWVSRVYKQFTDRLFSIVAPDGQAYGHALSTWALIDIHSRRPMDLAQLPGGGFASAVETGRTVPVEGPGRIRVKETVPVRSLPTFYSDLDINGHVNSIRYIEMVLDLFQDEIREKAVPCRIEMAYCAETYCGETLHLFTDAAAGPRRCVEIRKDGGETVVRASIELRETAV